MLSDFAAALSTTNVLVGICVLLVSLYVWSWLKVPKDLPPGPSGVPFLGFLPFAKKDLLQQFKELADQHGDIFSFFIGSKLIVVLNSYDAIKEALVKQADNFSARPLAQELKNEILMFFSTEGELFKEHKRFSLSTLKEFGFGKHSLEPNLKEEVCFLLKKISSFEGKPTDFGTLLKISISNVICAMINGKRFDYDNQNFRKLVSIADDHLSRSYPLRFSNFFPKILRYPGLRTLISFFHKTTSETNQQMVTELKKLIAARSAAHVSGQKHDFISAWFTELEDRKKNGTDKYFTDMHLVKLVQSLFLAGTDTTANSLRWAIMYMATNPEVQTKVQREIDDVIGQERMPSLTDQDQLPYTAATLMELQRIASLVPLSLFHCNFKETKLENYTIPKRSIIITNLWAVHHDPKTFPNPYTFDPQRFLDNDGRPIKNEKLIPFSQGKRQCLGEALAKMELFIYFSSLLQKFTFKVPDGETLNFDFDAAVVAIPKSQKIRAIERKSFTQ